MSRRTITRVGLIGAVALAMVTVLSCASGAAQSGSVAPDAVEPGELQAGEIPTVAIGQPFELAMGDVVTVAETGLQVSFRAVPEDSRCPARVNCIWAGRVSVELSVQAPSEAPEIFVLSTCCAASDSGPHAYAGQSIELRGVAPAPPPPGTPIPAQDYRAELVVSAS